MAIIRCFWILFLRTSIHWQWIIVHRYPAYNANVALCTTTCHLWTEPKTDFWWKTGNGQLTDIRWRNSNLLPDIRYGQKYIQRHPRNANTCKSFWVNFGFHELLIRAGGQKKTEIETREDKSDVTAFAELVTSFVDCSLFWCVSVVLCFLFFVLVH